jgi:hypothetical protein
MNDREGFLGIPYQCCRLLSCFKSSQRVSMDAYCMYTFECESVSWSVSNVL